MTPRGWIATGLTREEVISKLVVTTHTVVEGRLVERVTGISDPFIQIEMLIRMVQQESGAKEAWKVAALDALGRLT